MMEAVFVRKIKNRLQVMGFSSVYKASSQFFSILLSYLIIHWHSETLWGAYVAYLLIVQLASQVLAWGSGDFVLRAFSRAPHQLATIWQTALASRSIILIPILIGIYWLTFPLIGKLLLALWIVSDFLGGLFGALFNAINHHLSIYRMR